MKAVILAGGLGTRISEETDLKPKPMVEVGGKPILWHIMKIYSSYGIQDFIICLGYKGYVIKEYFANYYLHNSNVTFDMRNNKMEVHQNNSEPWKVTLVDTGDNTMTGGRLKQVEPYLNNEDAFCFTYGDGVSDVNITDLIEFHKHQNTCATVTAMQSASRFGVMELQNKKVIEFREKANCDGSWINGGYFVLSPDVFQYLDGDQCIWESEPMENLANNGQLSAFPHSGFWQPMDTLRDKNYLEELWLNKPPWKVWQ